MIWSRPWPQVYGLDIDLGPITLHITEYKYCEAQIENSLPKQKIREF